MDEIDELMLNDVVVIENQPCMRNPKMKSIQMLVYSYFVIRYNIDGKKNKKIVMMSANNKLKCYKGDTPLPLTTKSKSKYIQRKKMAIEHCKYFIKDNEIYHDFFMEHKKKMISLTLIYKDDII